MQFVFSQAGAGRARRARGIRKEKGFVLLGKWLQKRADCPVSADIYSVSREREAVDVRNAVKTLGDIFVLQMEKRTEWF